MRRLRAVHFLSPLMAMCLACGDPIEQVASLPEADMVAQACVGCVPVAQAAMEWLREHEQIQMAMIVLDLTDSGRESPQGDRVLDTSQLRSLAVSIGTQHGTKDDVLDCDDSRLLEELPRCQLRRGGLLVTLGAPVIRESKANIEIQRWGPGPGGSWWLARYQLRLDKSGSGWRVVESKLLNQS